MLEQAIRCVVAPTTGSRPIHSVRPADLPELLERLRPAQTRYLRELGFTASSGELAFLQDESGLTGAVFGLGQDRSRLSSLATCLSACPAVTQSRWHLVAGDYDPSGAVLAYALGAYRYTELKPGKRDPARLAQPEGTEWSLQEAASAWMVRDLINTPANLLGPAELAKQRRGRPRQNSYGAEPVIGYWRGADRILSNGGDGRPWFGTRTGGGEIRLVG